jgi:hypothetical protein
MYARTGLDDERLADWSSASAQDTSGRRPLTALIRRSTQHNFRVFNYVKSVVLKFTKWLRRLFTRFEALAEALYTI